MVNVTNEWMLSSIIISPWKRGTPQLTNPPPSWVWINKFQIWWKTLYRKKFTKMFCKIFYIYKLLILASRTYKCKTTSLSSDLTPDTYTSTLLRCSKFCSPSNPIAFTYNTDDGKCWCGDLGDGTKVSLCYFVY